LQDESTEGFAAALDTTTSIFPYFCRKPECSII